MDILFFCHLVHYLIIIQGFVSADEASEAKTIKDKLLKDYDKSLSPVLYARGNHYTFISLNVLRIRGLDEAKGEFIIESPMAFLWTDERLSWDSEKVKRLRIASDEIWTPHVNVLNRLEPNEVTIDPLLVAFQGAVWWAPRYVLRTSCIPNLRYYPFDEQKCDINIVLISQEGDALQANYTAPEVVNSAYLKTKFIVENNRWSLLSATSLKEKMKVDLETESEVGVFRFIIKRSMPLIALGILTPSLVSVVLLLSTFWMKAGNDVRTGISATSMLVSSSSLFTIGKILPVTGFATPIIVEYVAMGLIMSMATGLQSILVSVLSHCETSPPLSYATIIMKFPGWTLRLLGLSAETNSNEAIDQTFLFSDLAEIETKIPEETVDSPANSKEVTKASCLWEHHIILFDRLVFYIFGIIILLLIVSVMITE